MEWENRAFFRVDFVVTALDDFTTLSAVTCDVLYKENLVPLPNWIIIKCYFQNENYY